MSKRALLLLVSFLLIGCASDRLGDAFFENTVDTVTISSIRGTPISAPSAYSVAEDRLVRTDLSTNFDFVYYYDGARHLLLPLDVVGLGSRSSNPGLLVSSAAFGAIVNPPTSGYTADDSVVVSVGSVLVARSRIACSLSVPQYGKLEVLSFDDLARTMTFRIVANTNCGFRELGLGFPER